MEENCKEAPFNHSKVLVVVYSDVQMTILKLGKCAGILRIWDIRFCPCDVNEFLGSPEDLMYLYRGVYLPRLSSSGNLMDSWC